MCDGGGGQMRGGRFSLPDINCAACDIATD